MRFLRRTSEPEPPPPPAAEPPRPDLAVTRCVHIVQGDVALVRIAGTGAAAEAAALLADDGQEQSFPPLPEPDPGAGRWRAAFAVPSLLVTSDARFDLELRDGRVLELPQPTPDVTVSRTGDDPSRMAALERRLRLIQAAEESRGRKLVEAWSECNELRVRLEEARGETETLRGELGSVCELLSEAHASQGRCREAETELAECRAELGELRATVDDLHAELDERRGRRLRFLRRRRERALEEAGFRARRAEAVADSLRERAYELELELDDESARGDELRSALEAERDRPVRRRGDPWSPEEHDLLARIEKAKIVARSRVAERPRGAAEPTC